MTAPDPRSRVRGMSNIAAVPVQLPGLAAIVLAFWWVPALNERAGGGGTAFAISAGLAFLLPLIAAAFAYGHRHGSPSCLTMLLGFVGTGVQVWLWFRLRGGWLPAGMAEAILWNHGLLHGGAVLMVARGVLVRVSARAARRLDGEFAEFLGHAPRGDSPAGPGARS